MCCTCDQVPSKPQQPDTGLCLPSPPSPQVLATEKAELQRGKQEAERQLAQLQQHMQVGWARGICCKFEATQ